MMMNIGVEFVLKGHLILNCELLFTLELLSMVFSSKILLKHVLLGFKKKNYFLFNLLMDLTIWVCVSLALSSHAG